MSFLFPIFNIHKPKRKVYAKKQLLKCVFYICAVIAICILLVYAYNKPTDRISSIALAISIYISVLQDLQLKKLKVIGEQTKSTTETLGTNTEMRNNVKNFFPKNTENNTKSKYKLFYPVYNEGKTLPLMNEADSYAMHVISDLLGVSNLELKPVSLKTTDPDDMESKCKDELRTSDSIILCDVNPALKQFCKFIMNTNTLPCWFKECDSTIDKDKKYNRGKTQKIVLKETTNTSSLDYSSPSEKCCVDAVDFKNELYLPEQAIQHDYGILARLSHNGYKYIIIAGIHGYGTWITASYLSNILWKGSKKYNNQFFGNDDFIAIIGGDFNTKSLYADFANMKVVEIWQRDENNWKKVPDN